MTQEAATTSSNTFKKTKVLPLTTLVQYINETRNLNEASQLHMQQGTLPEEMGIKVQVFGNQAQLTEQGYVTGTYPIIYEGDFHEEGYIEFDSLKSYPHQRIDTLTPKDLVALEGASILI